MLLLRWRRQHKGLDPRREQEATFVALAAGAGPTLAKASATIVRAARISPIPLAFIFRRVPRTPAGRLPAPGRAGSSPAGLGPLRLVEVELPARLGAPSEPLVVTGPGSARATFLGVIRVDDRHVRFTCDHWGHYSLASADILLGEGPRHVIELLLGSLLPSAGSPWYDAHAPVKPLARRLYVVIDGREAFDRDTEFYPAAAAEAYVGVNPLGKSTTEAPALHHPARILKVEKSLDLRFAPPP